MKAIIHRYFAVQKTFLSPEGTENLSPWNVFTKLRYVALLPTYWKKGFLLLPRTSEKDSLIMKLNLVLQQQRSLKSAYVYALT